MRDHPAYRADLDGLRALAIIPVLLFHAFPTVMPGGFVGVDIFFVISGFLISSIIFRGLQRERFSFPGFYENRVKRIFPALLLVLGACAVFGWFSLLPDEYAQLGKHILGGAGYVENLVLRREAGYFDTNSFFKPLMHLWSLGIEEQFYLTYPFLLWAVWRLRGKLLAIMIALVLISFFAQCLASPHRRHVEFLSATVTILGAVDGGRSGLPRYFQTGCRAPSDWELG